MDGQPQPHEDPPPAQLAPEPLTYATPAPPESLNLRAVAIRQKAVCYCILAYFALVIVSCGGAASEFSEELALIVGLLGVGVVISAAVFTFMLAIELYGVAWGIILGLLSLIPFIGLIGLLIVNGGATQALRRHSIRVGLMGARSSEIPQQGQQLTLRPPRPNIIRRQ